MVDRVLLLAAVSWATSDDVEPARDRTSPCAILCVGSS